MLSIVIAAIAGLGVGVFCPAIARKLKASFGKEVAAVDSAAKADVSKVEADAKAEVKKL